MWEPSAPSPVETSPMTYPQIRNNIHVNLESQVGFPGNSKFFMCRSAIRDGRCFSLCSVINLADSNMSHGGCLYQLTANLPFMMTIFRFLLQASSITCISFICRFVAIDSYMSPHCFVSSISEMILLFKAI